MSRLPTPGGDEGTWGDILNDYLRTSHKNDGTLKDGVVSDAQISSLSQAKINGLTAALDQKAGKSGAQFSRSLSLVDPVPVAIVLWRAPFACLVKKVSAYRIGGTGATINARKNSSSNLLPIDLSVSTTGNWVDGGTPQNASIVPGDTLEIVVAAASGSPAQLIVQIDLETA